MRTFCSIVGALAACVAAQVASANVITVNFTGSFSQIFGTPYTGAAVGDTFSGSLSYESSTAPTADSPSTQTAFYDTSIISMNVTVQTAGGPVAITADTFSGLLGSIGNPAAGQQVVNDTPDLFNASRVIDTFHTMAGVSSTNTGLFLSLDARTTIPDFGPLTSRALPENLILSQFPRNSTSQFQIVGPGPGFILASGALTSLQVVPAPSCALFLGVGGATQLISRRRRTP